MLLYQKSELGRGLPTFRALTSLRSFPDTGLCQTYLSEPCTLRKRIFVPFRCVCLVFTAKCTAQGCRNTYQSNTSEITHLETNRKICLFILTNKLVIIICFCIPTLFAGS